MALDTTEVVDKFSSMIFSTKSKELPVPCTNLSWHTGMGTKLTPTPQTVYRDPSNEASTCILLMISVEWYH